jgi:hypothetical protein
VSVASGGTFVTTDLENTEERRRARAQTLRCSRGGEAGRRVLLAVSTSLFEYSGRTANITLIWEA